MEADSLKTSCGRSKIWRMDDEMKDVHALKIVI
jgi:hypothetical protein